MTTPRFFRDGPAFGRWLETHHANEPELWVGIYSFEKEVVAFTCTQATEFKRSAQAWKWFNAEAPSYRGVATHWVTAAKQEATRARRLASLIAHCAEGKKLRQFTPLDQRAK